MDISNQLNQKFFGRKELEILNQKPKPPSIKTIRKPSDVDENYNNDEGVVGYMGNDEDLESIKYDIMDNMNQKMNNFDDRIEKLLNQIQTMEANKDKLNRLELGQDSLLRVVEEEENEIEAVGVEAASDGSGNIEHMLDVIASARPCTALGRETESRELIDKGDDRVCTKFYNRSSPKYGSYRSGDVQYGRSCKAHYLGSVSNPIENPPDYCKDYNGRVAQKCNTIVGSSPPNAGPFTPDRNNCVKLNNSDSNPAQQLWVDKCSQYLGKDPCNASEDCIYRKIGNVEKCIFNCEKLNTSLGEGNISDDVKCKKENGYYESTDYVSLNSVDTLQTPDILQDYCEQFISPKTCNSDSDDKCHWDDNLDVLGYDFKCIPHEDSNTCNLSESFKQLLKDSGEKCKSLTSSPCCNAFSDVCSYENGTCSSSLSWPPDHKYYNLWRIGDYILTLMLSFICVVLYFKFKKPEKKINIVIPLVVFLLNICKIVVYLWIEKYFDFINIDEWPTFHYWMFSGIPIVILIISSTILLILKKKNERGDDGGGSDDAGGGSGGGGGSDEDGIGLKGIKILGLILILLVGYSVFIFYTNKVNDTICDTDIAYTDSHKITEYCNSINKSYDRTPEYNIAYGDDDKEFSDKCRLPCKKYAKNKWYQRLTPLITCFVSIIFSVLGFFIMDVKIWMLVCLPFLIGSISLILIGNLKSPVCKAKNKDDSEKCNSITNPDICKAALHRDGGANEDKNICFLYHGPFFTYFSVEYIGLFFKDIGWLAIILCVVLLVSLVIIGGVPQGLKNVKDWKQRTLDNITPDFI